MCHVQPIVENTTGINIHGYPLHVKFILCSKLFPFHKQNKWVQHQYGADTYIKQ